jgi:mRNA-degrading endonuclease RelE of RelBE toxin-antitoxin system
MPEPSFAPDALRQLRKLRVYEQRIIVDGIQKHLVQASPTQPSQNTFRLRRTSQWADFEPRLGNLRVFYRVNGVDLVTITVIGVKKGNVLLVEGKEFQL